MGTTRLLKPSLPPGGGPGHPTHWWNPPRLDGTSTLSQTCAGHRGAPSPERRGQLEEGCATRTGDGREWSLGTRWGGPSPTQRPAIALAAFLPAGPSSLTFASDLCLLAIP